MINTHKNAVGQALAGRFRTDLRSKIKLLSAAQRCLEDERCYRFFDLLASISSLSLQLRSTYLEEITSTGDYDVDEIAALKRLLLDGGAAAGLQARCRRRQGHPDSAGNRSDDCRMIHLTSVV